MNKKIKKTSANVIDNICDNCSMTGYCTLKEILLVTQHLDDRVLVQMKCIEIFKYEQSEKEGYDIGWSEAGMRWVDQLWASHFADVYDPNKKPRIIYQEIKKLIT